MRYYYIKTTKLTLSKFFRRWISHITDRCYEIWIGIGHPQREPQIQKEYENCTILANRSLGLVWVRGMAVLSNHVVSDDLERPWRSFELFETLMNPISLKCGICCSYMVISVYIIVIKMPRLLKVTCGHVLCPIANISETVRDSDWGHFTNVKPVNGQI